jgi:hypothetical protein
MAPTFECGSGWKLCRPVITAGCISLLVRKKKVLLIGVALR